MLTFHTFDLDYETRITTSKKNLKLKSQQSNIK